MRTPTILLCGANGFIGRHIHARLRQAGFQVKTASRHGETRIDFRRATTAGHWLDALHGVDAVINAVGILRDNPGQPMAMIHDAAPRALFAACAQLGIRRVLQISALGVTEGDTAYARSKRAADTHLLALNAQGQLDGIVLRPSLVFGMDGDSTRLFLRLAKLPLLPLPKAVIRAQVQPLAVWELAEVCSRLLQDKHDTGVLELAGPQALGMGEYIACLRQQLGKTTPASVLPLPDAITRVAARIGDALPFSPLFSEALQLLARDNRSEAGHLARLLHRPPCAPDAFISTSAELRA
ncbi:MAG: NAD-dependent epimerase/dehydratase family protein [Pseudomonadota bacterium]|nr:NAD-dependent epimerase/dehydratase family protein [Pseudomonadota bacterium]